MRCAIRVVVERMRTKLLEFLSERGTLLEPEAVDYLLSYDNPVEHLNQIWGNLSDSMQSDAVLSLSSIREAEKIARDAANSAAARVIAVVRASDVEPDFRIIRNVAETGCGGGIDDFARFFNSRYRTLGRMLGARRELHGCIDISRVRKSSGEIRFIGIVSSADFTKKGHRIIDIEDRSGSTKVPIPNNSTLIGDPMVEDEVVGIVGTRSNDIVIASSIVRPEVPADKCFRKADGNILAAFISDIHVGSRYFLRDQWDAFADWLKGEPAVRYIVMAGDLIDGVGIYPKQEEDLVTDDIFEQHQELSRLLSEFPADIKLILIPGNHDAVRPAEPQPALAPEFRKLFREGIEFLSNPSCFSLNGVEVLAYHGKGMDDLVGQLNNASYDKPLPIMKAMLQKRHLAPIYGGKTPLAPDRDDALIIDRVPDIFVTGHVHSAGIDNYRGIKLINSSTWQAQTPYQKMHNMTPECCKVAVVNLGTGEAWLNDFLT